MTISKNSLKFESLFTGFSVEILLKDSLINDKNVSKFSLTEVLNLFRQIITHLLKLRDYKEIYLNYSISFQMEIM